MAPQCELVILAITYPLLCKNCMKISSLEGQFNQFFKMSAK